MTTQPNDIGHRVATGALWMLLTKIAARSLGIVSMIVLARLLTPGDFGLVAIAMSFYALMALISQFGFDTVLIQMREVDRSHYDTAWSLNLAFGVLSSIVIASAAPYLAAYFDDPRLSEIIHVTGFMFIISGAQNVGVVDFRKKLQFDKEFYFSTVPRCISFFVTLVLSFWLRNYWALVWGMVTMRVSSTLLSFVMSPYRPRLTFTAYSELFNFSKWLMFKNMITFLDVRAPDLIVGKLISPVATGLLSVAKELPMNAVMDVVATLNRATYPGYSLISDDMDRLRALYLKVLASVSIYTLPMSIGMIYLADPLIPTFLGQQWLACIPLVQFATVASMISTLNSNTFYIFLALGNPRLPTIIFAVRVVVLLPAVAILTHFYGLLGAALSLIIASVAGSIPTAVVMRRRIGITWSMLVEIHKRPAISTATMCIAMHVVELCFPTLTSRHPITALAVLTATGAATFVTTILLLWWLNGFPDGPEAKVTSEVRGLWQRLLAAGGRRPDVSA